jgi:hypothetical protein
MTLPTIAEKYPAIHKEAVQQIKTKTELIAFLKSQQTQEGEVHWQTDTTECSLKREAIESFINFKLDAFPENLMMRSTPQKHTGGARRKENLRICSFDCIEAYKQGLRETESLMNLSTAKGESQLAESFRKEFEGLKADERGCEKWFEKRAQREKQHEEERKTINLLSEFGITVIDDNTVTKDGTNYNTDALELAEYLLGINTDLLHDTMKRIDSLLYSLRPYLRKDGELRNGFSHKVRRRAHNMREELESKREIINLIKGVRLKKAA